MKIRKLSYSNNDVNLTVLNALAHRVDLVDEGRIILIRRTERAWAFEEGARRFEVDNEVPPVIGERAVAFALKGKDPFYVEFSDSVLDIPLRRAAWIPVINDPLLVYAPKKNAILRPNVWLTSWRHFNGKLPDGLEVFNLDALTSFNVPYLGTGIMSYTSTSDPSFAYATFRIPYLKEAQ